MAIRVRSDMEGLELAGANAVAVGALPLRQGQAEEQHVGGLQQLVVQRLHGVDGPGTFVEADEDALVEHVGFRRTPSASSAVSEHPVRVRRPRRQSDRPLMEKKKSSGAKVAAEGDERRRRGQDVLAYTGAHPLAHEHQDRIERGGVPGALRVGLGTAGQGEATERENLGVAGGQTLYPCRGVKSASSNVIVITASEIVLHDRDEGLIPDRVGGKRQPACSGPGLEVLESLGVGALRRGSNSLMTEEASRLVAVAAGALAGALQRGAGAPPGARERARSPRRSSGPNTDGQGEANSRRRRSTRAVGTTHRSGGGRSWQAAKLLSHHFERGASSPSARALAGAAASASAAHARHRRGG